MADNTTKISKSYSLDPAVIAWVTQRAAQLTIQSANGERSNDSKVVNDILIAAMVQEQKRRERRRATERQGTASDGRE